LQAYNATKTTTIKRICFIFYPFLFYLLTQTYKLENGFSYSHKLINVQDLMFRTENIQTVSSKNFYDITTNIVFIVQNSDI